MLNKIHIFRHQGLSYIFELPHETLPNFHHILPVSFYRLSHYQGRQRYLQVHFQQLDHPFCAENMQHHWLHQMACDRIDKVFLQPQRQYKVCHLN